VDSFNKNHQYSTVKREFSRKWQYRKNVLGKKHHLPQQRFHEQLLEFIHVVRGVEEEVLDFL
jgi:hypothetical protein